MRNLYVFACSFLLSCVSLVATAQSNTIVPFYMVLGQSNTGWCPAGSMTTADAAQYKGLIPQTEIWNPGHGAFSAVIEPLNVGLNTMCENYADNSQFGPEASLMKQLHSRNPRKRLVFKQGQGGTTLAGDWRPTLPGQYEWQAGGRWQQFTQWLELAVNQANQKGYKLDLKGIIWMQGEDDAKTVADANAYAVNLTRFFVSIENVWNKVVATYQFPQSGYKKVIGRIYAPVGYPYRDSVRAAQARYCANPANNAILIDCDSYPLQDWVHYSATGQVMFGVDIFNAAGFEQDAQTLPITLGSLKAFTQTNKIVLEWKADNEADVKSYEVERSADGITFSTVGSKQPLNSLQAVKYTWLDDNPYEGTNFYRLRSTSYNGKLAFTPIIRISTLKAAAGYNVYPNPIVGGNVNIQFSNKPKGNYTVNLLTTSGQVVLAKTINHQGGNATQTVVAAGILPKGHYTVELVAPDNSRQTLRILQ
ncbi:T9SS type A sorting domain-containing protein [Segetibacter sp. 3557_3]|uniref:sialate O-acetylesterase n=1 Tax=Segetibacter sp. 3557_3 TaxID=2547429 RepID=UPI00105885C8|nr:sialate O-acetylesterase [Segetibacter sp. 3557_3]TDH26217.1 T9SS type A sorting domain-containing protein [Segetibacter sp. 3557_3]